MFFASFGMLLMSTVLLFVKRVAMGQPTRLLFFWLKTGPAQRCVKRTSAMGIRSSNHYRGNLVSLEIVKKHVEKFDTLFTAFWSRYFVLHCFVSKGHVTSFYYCCPLGNRSWTADIGGILIVWFGKNINCTVRYGVSSFGCVCQHLNINR